MNENTTTITIRVCKYMCVCVVYMTWWPLVNPFAIVSQLGVRFNYTWNNMPTILNSMILAKKVIWMKRILLVYGPIYLFSPFYTKHFRICVIVFFFIYTNTHWNMCAIARNCNKIFHFILLFQWLKNGFYQRKLCIQMWCKKCLT